MSQVGACGRSNEKTRRWRVFYASKNRSHLLDLAFLVDHVFAYRRVELADLDFLRVEPLVLGRRVEVPGSCR